MYVNIDRQIDANRRMVILYKECNKCDVGLPVIHLHKEEFSTVIS